MTTTPDAKQALRVKLLGKTGSALAYMIRDFLHRSDVPFEWIELHSDEEARTLAGVEGLNDSRLPVCIFAAVLGGELNDYSYRNAIMGSSRDARYAG